MEATVMHSAGDARVEKVPDPIIAEHTDALARLVATP